MTIDQYRMELNENLEQLLVLFERRQHLSRLVAKEKGRTGMPVHVPQREAELFSWTRRRCGELHLDPDFVLEIVSLLIAHGKYEQCAELGLQTFMDTGPQDPDVLHSNLLQLAKAAAPTYHLRHSNQDALALFLNQEQTLLELCIDNIGRHSYAVDLGCANGSVCAMMEDKFRYVVGIDVSNAMLDQARGRRAWSENVEFKQHDLRRGIPLEDGVADLVVANFGAASIVCTDIFPEVSRVLRPGGTAFLSFYNRNAISTRWYYPWPTTLRSRFNPHNDTLEVWEGDSVYTIHATGVDRITVREGALLSGLQEVQICTHPGFMSVLPRFMFSSPHFQPLVKAVAECEAQDDGFGTYYTAIYKKRSPE